MKVLIIGAGALGIGIGATLKQGGAEVDFIARGKTAHMIKQEGIARDGIFGKASFSAGEIGVYEDAAGLPKDAYDYVIVATKATANEEVSELLSTRKDCMKAGVCICFMQNGIGYEKPFLRFFTQEQVFHSRVITGFSKSDKLSESVVTVHQAPVLIGSCYGEDPAPVAPLVEALTKGGVPAETVDTETLSQALWAKLIYNTALNPLGAILHRTYGQLADSEYARSIIDILIEEAYAVMRSCGAKTFYEDADAYRKALYEEMIPATYDHQSSMLQDIEKRQKTEIDFLNGSLLNIASGNSVDAVMHSLVYTLIKALEETFED